jgi:uncharacterized membrane protein
MSWLERATLAHALRALIVYGWFLSRPWTEDLTLLGWRVLMLIVGTVVLGIIVQMTFVILAMVTGQERDLQVEDERDKMIEAQAMVRGFTFVGFGFLAATLALWQGWGAVWAFHLMLAGMVASDVTICLMKAWRYARGL